MLLAIADTRQVIGGGKRRALVLSRPIVLGNIPGGLRSEHYSRRPGGFVATNLVNATSSNARDRQSRAKVHADVARSRAEYWPKHFKGAMSICSGKFIRETWSNFHGYVGARVPPGDPHHASHATNFTSHVAVHREGLRIKGQTDRHCGHARCKRQVKG